MTNKHAGGDACGPVVGKRTDADYEIEALSKGLMVLKALEDGPVKRSRVEQITKFNRDLVMRTLKTLRLHGFAVENERKEWSFGPGIARIGQEALKRV